MKKPALEMVFGVGAPKKRGTEDEHEEHEGDQEEEFDHRKAKLQAVAELREALASEDDEGALDAFEALCDLCDVDEDDEAPTDEE